VIRRLIAVLALVASASPAAAQSGIMFFPRFDFHLGADHLSNSDPRFVWDTNFGGDMDFVDYGRGRTTFAANYEAVLGNQLRRFDPNQGNYLLDLSSSLRVHGVEVAALLHHTSRHLSDRFKRTPVDWNMFGVSVERDMHRGSVLLHAQGDALDTLLKSSVDYNWETNGSLQLRVPIRPGIRRISMISEGRVRLVGVDGSLNRGTQHGARAEAGLRFEGQGGAIELIVAAERRIDAYPLETAAMSWVSAGFRFVSR
jgi:hypothetical protein